MRHTYSELTEEAIAIIAATGTDNISQIHSDMSDSGYLASIGVGPDQVDAIVEVSEWSGTHLWAYKVHEDGHGVHAWESVIDYDIWCRQQ